MTKKETEKKEVKKQKRATASKKKVRQFFSLTEHAEREIELDDGVLKKLEAGVKKANKNGATITLSDLVANLIMEKAHELKFRPDRPQKKNTRLKLPTGLWAALDDAASRNKATVDETLCNLSQSL